MTPPTPEDQERIRQWVTCGHIRAVLLPVMEASRALVESVPDLKSAHYWEVMAERIEDAHTYAAIRHAKVDNAPE
jgi:hypothetical protein